jgi:tetratricopeptide (TPR) repeat protein
MARLGWTQSNLRTTPVKESTVPHRPKFLNHLAHVLFPGSTPGRLAAIGVGSFVGALVLWTTPLSPSAVGRADAALGLGDPGLAVERYDAVARWNPLPWQREEALYRSAMVHAVDLHDGEGARVRLEELVREHPGSSRLAEVYDTIGQLTLDVDHRPEDAARAFLGAYEADPIHALAAGRLMAAARARSEGGDVEGAADLWDRVQKRFPKLRGQALLAQAELLLASSDAEGALPLYELAGQVSDNADQKAVARLGAAACMERLGDLEGAIAEIDSSDLPQGVREERTQRLKARLAAGETR